MVANTSAVTQISAFRIILMKYMKKRMLKLLLILSMITILHGLPINILINVEMIG